MFVKLWRIAAKAVLSIVREDIQVVVGPLQLCAGQMAGVETAVHSVCELFDNDGCNADLLHLIHSGRSIGNALLRSGY